MVREACSVPDCQVAGTGECAEGHTPLGACPNFYSDRDFHDEDIRIQVEAPSPTADSLIRLPSGDLMTSAEVQRFLLARPANIIAIVGDSNSGKTTLLCSIYDRFLRAPFAGLSFVASRTLIALERRIHSSRVDSGRSVPDTVRTSIADGLRFFHLALSPTESPNRRIDLLLADRAGETYRKARNKTDHIADLAEIPQADKIVLLLDGGKIANPVERSGAMQDTRQMLRALIDNGALDRASNVQVVTSKFDLLSNTRDKDDVAAARKAFQEKLTADFGSRLKDLSFWDVSARDPTGALNAAHGVDALLNDWTLKSSFVEPVKLGPIPVKSEFDRFLLRTIPVFR